MRTLIHETRKAWLTESPAPVWLRDGSFLWLSERSGWQHLYRYPADGTLDRQVTNGSWELRTLHGVDEARGWVYFSGTERSPIGGDVYRIHLDGSGLERLSQDRRQPPRVVQSGVRLLCRRLERCVDAAAGAAASR